MKRLMDETTDELARSLLEAGIEHRPPPGNKARVIVALGAGGALGLFGSNAFAWLSTSAGKVTAVGVAVGVAGAVWVAAPPAREAHSGAEGSSAKITAQLQAEAVDGNAAANHVAAGNVAAGNVAAGNEPIVGARRAEPESSTAALALNGEHRSDTLAGDERSADMQASEAEISESPRASAGADTAAADERKAHASRRERAARKLGARKSLGKQKVAQSERRRDGSPSAAEASLAEGALDERTVEQADLDSEVRLVDDMHSAARRNDREALGRFLERYRTAFPDGQLKREVAEFAARMEHPDLSVPR